MDRGKTSMQRRRGVTPGFLESGLCHRDVKRGAQGVRSPSADGVATTGCCVGSTRALTLKAGTQVL